MSECFEVDFLPVGENSCSGDAICLRYGSPQTGYNINIVDGGYASTTEAIVSHLNSFYGRPTRIDNVVLTHADRDHAAGLVEILERYEVGALWMNRPWLYADQVIHHFHGNWSVPGLISHLRNEYDKLVELETIANRKGIPIYEPLQGAQIGEFVVLAPSRERYITLIPDLDKAPQVYSEKALDWLVAVAKKAVAMVRETWSGETLSNCPEPTSASNESSVVQAAILDNKLIVLTGDTGPEGLIEAADHLARLGTFQPYLFQVPHHGSRRNVTPEALNRWLGAPLAIPGQSRGVAYCSAAADDKEHPRKKVLNAFIRRGYPVHTTNGAAKGHRNNMPARLGWSSSVAESFSWEVEE
jgi:beta-lactamase superfamily II metal-dependent hydrolase